MDKKLQYATFLIQLIIALATSMLGGSAAAQPGPATPVDASISSADAFRITERDRDGRQVGWAITVVFDKNFDPNRDTQNLGRSHYRLIDVKNSSFVVIAQAHFVIVPGNTVSRIRLVIPSADGMSKDDIYHLYATDLTFGGTPAKDASKLQHVVEFKLEPDDQGKLQPKVDETNTAEISAHAPPKAPWALKESKGREDSDLYGSYELTASRGKPTTGSGDFKVKLPFFRTFWNRTHRISPLVDFKASSDEKADPDSLKFAVEWFMPLYVGNDPDADFPYTAVDWVNTGKVEAPKNFDNINGLWETKFLFPSSRFPWNSKRFRVFLDPFAGAELGKNLRSPLKSIEGKGLARLMVGADLTIQIKVPNLAALKGFEFNSAYIRRWPLKQELLVDKDSQGNLVALSLSKGPKDYSDSKFVIKVSDYFGPFVGYQWGRLPPNYQLVDHKWTFGLLFKSKVRAK